MLTWRVCLPPARPPSAPLSQGSGSLLASAETKLKGVHALRIEWDGLRKGGGGAASAANTTAELSADGGGGGDDDGGGGNKHRDGDGGAGSAAAALGACPSAAVYQQSASSATLRGSGVRGASSSDASAALAKSYAQRSRPARTLRGVAYAASSTTFVLEAVEARRPRSAVSTSNLLAAGGGVRIGGALARTRSSAQLRPTSLLGPSHSAHELRRREPQALLRAPTKLYATGRASSAIPPSPLPPALIDGDADELDGQRSGVDRRGTGRAKGGDSHDGRTTAGEGWSEAPADAAGGRGSAMVAPMCGGGGTLMSASPVPLVGPCYAALPSRVSAEAASEARRAATMSAATARSLSVAVDDDLSMALGASPHLASSASAASLRGSASRASCSRPMPSSPAGRGAAGTGGTGAAPAGFAVAAVGSRCASPAAIATPSSPVRSSCGGGLIVHPQSKRPPLPHTVAIPIDRSSRLPPKRGLPDTAELCALAGEVRGSGMGSRERLSRLREVFDAIDEVRCLLIGMGSPMRPNAPGWNPMKVPMRAPQCAGMESNESPNARAPMRRDGIQ